MCYKQKNGDLNRIITSTNSIFVSALITSIVLSAAVGGLSSLTIQRVSAQMSNNSSMTNNIMSGSNMGMGSNMVTIPPKTPQLNITIAAPPLTPAMFKSLAPQMHIDLVNAIMIAQKWLEVLHMRSLLRSESKMALLFIVYRLSMGILDYIK